ncbi:DUF2637 domain-containing protein [Streptomyces sp. NBC_01261]|uniref:DUF2637 domain-containing protein n=1 Tax=Streptomyces sp. NBC_01261 TaxID=2903802 RepID=UPI003FCD3841
MVIAGIGFAGSYAAVRELALKKGFGTFAYVFPIGIDAGICVLLALDLLLTWIRIPFPLLRQTAWLLTAATIAFNGAAAWPDPLGVGMHAVIPILFVVSVEAARHAIGRIADITADKHMEGVRLTRWLLSPIPTFLLWRRMKLWELRSYEQAIKREQDRLVYQARLHTRYGHAWRHKAPVESIMPLRLTRYGIPLTQTTPTGLTATDIEPELHPPTPQSEPAREPEQPTAPTVQHTPAPPGPAPDRSVTRTTRTEATALRREQVPGPNLENNKPPEQPEHIPHPGPEDEDNTPSQQPQHIPQPEQNTSAWFNGTLQEAAYKDGYNPEYDLKEHTHNDEEQERERDEQPPALHTTPDETASNSSPPTHMASETQQPGHSPSASEHVGAPLRHTQTPHSGEEAGPTTPALSNKLTSNQLTSGEPTTPPRHGLTPVDRYYLAWQDLHQQLDTEPDAAQLSAYLARQGILDRDNQPIRPKTLARYFLQFRIYTVWAHHRAIDDHPDPDHVTKDLAQHGITAQYNQPIHTTDLKKHHHTFEHRWQGLTRQGMP